MCGLVGYIQITPSTQIAEAPVHAIAVTSVQSVPDDIMVKVDRAEMGVSLKTRAPYLDHRLFEFAWCLPLSVKTRDGQRKWILRRLLDRYVCAALQSWPKQGFGVLIGPLREWAEALLDENRLRREGWITPTPSRQARQECWQ